jgi:hypothetical protein
LRVISTHLDRAQAVGSELDRPGDNKPGRSQMLLEPAGELPKSRGELFAGLMDLPIASCRHDPLSPALPHQFRGKREPTSHRTGRLASERCRGDTGDRE